MIIELYRTFNAIFLAHQEQSCPSRAAALCLDGRTLMFSTTTQPQEAMLNAECRTDCLRRCQCCMWPADKLLPVYQRSTRTERLMNITDQL